MRKFKRFGGGPFLSFRGRGPNHLGTALLLRMHKQLKKLLPAVQVEYSSLFCFCNFTNLLKKSLLKKNLLNFMNLQKSLLKLTEHLELNTNWSLKLTSMLLKVKNKLRAKRLKIGNKLKTARLNSKLTGSYKKVVYFRLRKS